MITYLFFALNTFLFTWYSSKLLRDVSGRDQYWHIPQMIMLAGFFLMPLAVDFSFGYLIKVICWGCMFPFLFNTGLNLYRKLPIAHLGKYDFLKFGQIVVLFLIGLSLTIIFEIWIKKLI